MDDKNGIDALEELFSRRLRTNYFSPKEDLYDLLPKKRLAKQEFAGGSYLFCGQDNREDVYYFVEEGAVLPEMEKGTLPLILSLVQMEGKVEVPSREVWEAIGFEPYLTRRRMYLTSESLFQQERNPVYAGEEWAEEISRLMQKSFEPYTAQHLSMTEVQEEIRKRQILVVTQADKLLGFLHFETAKKTSILWHIAVEEEARGRGIGEGLVRDWLFAQEACVRRFVLWVREDNSSARSMYKKIGFAADGRLAPVMIKR